MISTGGDAAAVILENDEQLINGLLRAHNINCGEETEGNQTYQYSDEEDEEFNKEWDKYDNIERQLQPPRSRGHKDTLRYTININKSKNQCRLVTLIPTAEYKSRSKNFKRFDVATKDKPKKIANESFTDKRICPECKENVDAYALFIIRKMIDNQLLKTINHTLEIDPRWYIYHANCNSSYPLSLDTSKIPSELPKECTVKIFKEDYESYPDVRTTNETRQLWGQREFTNLKRAWGVIPCPQPIFHKHHVVVSSFIGRYNHELAPKIRFVKFKHGEYITIYQEIVESMKVLYEKANVIHGNLSEYTILWHNRKCYFVDFAQALQPHEEAAFDCLFMDCKNITKFFRDHDVPNMFTTDGLFEHITGYSYKHKPSLAKLVESSKKLN